MMKAAGKRSLSAEMFLFLFAVLSAMVASSSGLAVVCKVGCTCIRRSLQEPISAMTCDGIGLTKIPKLQMYRNLTKLSLPNNHISVIRADDLSPVMNSIQEIVLHNNSIHTIKEDALNSLSNLIILDLSNNRLESLPQNAFDGQSRFNELILSHNRLSEIPPAVLGVTEYTRLLLDNNPLGNMKQNAFSGAITTVTELDISGIGMTSFNSAYLGFANFSSMERLDLDQNHFDTLDSKMFQDVPSTLRTLSMRLCGIRMIGRAAFVSLPQLQNLFLDGNNLGVVFNQPFANLRLEKLDLANCSITDLKKTAFKKLSVKELHLSLNNISVVHRSDFKGISGIKFIHLRGSQIAEIRGTPFSNLVELEKLDLQNNSLTTEGLGTALNDLSRTKLERLVLSDNQLDRFPDFNNSKLLYLQYLWVTHNQISNLTRGDLRGMPSLKELFMSYNPMSGFPETGDDTFADCHNLKKLNFDSTSLTHLPNMTYLPQLTVLKVNGANLTKIPDDICCTCSKLSVLETGSNSLRTIPSLSCSSLVDLDFSNNMIEELPPTLAKELPNLRSLDLESNKITQIPDDFFSNSKSLEFLFINKNLLHKLPKLEGAPHLVTFEARENKIQKIEKDAFTNQVIMDKLFLSDNQITSIHPQAFAVNSDLKQLDLSNNKDLAQWTLPQGGFPFLAVLHLEGMKQLYQVPHPNSIPKVKELYLTYSYHCCIWDRYKIQRNESNIITDGSGPVVTEATVPPIPSISPEIELCEEIKKFADDFNKHSNSTGVMAVVGPPPECELDFIDVNISSNNTGTSNPADTEVSVLFTSRTFNNINVTYRREVLCTPHENPLTPCENLMDPWVLRVAIWAIWVLALFGNGTVLFIGIAAREKLKSNDFLICNLAFADFCMGIYLAFLAVVDIRTFGDRSFFQSALEWQFGPGCKSAGFIAVFSSELSVYTLVVLTLERVHAIASPYNENEKKRKRIALALCVFGWLVAAILATLPLVGVNSYDKVAVCLPYLSHDNEEDINKAYVGFVLTINFIGFLVIVFSYIYIFTSACKNTPPSNTSQKRRKDIFIAASKIAVLIFTAFLCWAPIAVIGYFALFDNFLVNATQAKYFIVFVYPLNACVNPFIYFIFTQRFRRRFMSIFKRSKDQVTSFPHNNHMRLQRTPGAFTSEYPMSRIHSPGNQKKQEELMKLRQSRRSNSLVVQLVDSNLNTPSPTFTTPIGCNLGRRASLPPGFGSTLNSLNTAGINGNNSGNNHSNLPHYSLPFRLGSAYSSNNSSLPNLEEEDMEHDVFQQASSTDANALTSSQESNLRRLSVVEEENEGDLIAGNPTSDDNERGNEDEVSSSSSSDEEYSDASDSLTFGKCERGTDLDHVISHRRKEEQNSLTEPCEEVHKYRENGRNDKVSHSAIDGSRKSSFDSSSVLSTMAPVSRTKSHSCDDLQLWTSDVPPEESQREKRWYHKNKNFHESNKTSVSNGHQQPNPLTSPSLSTNHGTKHQNCAHDLEGTDHSTAHLNNSPQHKVMNSNNNKSSSISHFVHLGFSNPLLTAIQSNGDHTCPNPSHSICPVSETDL